MCARHDGSLKTLCRRLDKRACPIELRTSILLSRTVSGAQFRRSIALCAAGLNDAGESPLSWTSRTTDCSTFPVGDLSRRSRRSHCGKFVWHERTRNARCPRPRRSGACRTRSPRRGTISRLSGAWRRCCRFYSGAPVFTVPPDLALALFIAPVLLDAAFDTSVRDLKDNWVPVTSLSVIAVGLTTAAVALVARALVPELPWPAAIALGAVVAPPDAAAATAVLRQLQPPHRILTILEGESLLNDATRAADLSPRDRCGGRQQFLRWRCRRRCFLVAVAGSLIVGPRSRGLTLRVTRRHASMRRPRSLLQFADHLRRLDHRRAHWPFSRAHDGVLTRITAALIRAGAHTGADLRSRPTRSGTRSSSC